MCMRKPINRKSLHTWEAMVGFGCFVGGILAPLLGMLLLAVEWAGATTAHWFHVSGTGLLIMGIPLILFAGFCLDWAEAGQKSDNNKC